MCPAHFGTGFANIGSLQSNENAYCLFNHTHVDSHDGDVKVRLEGLEGGLEYFFSEYRVWSLEHGSSSIVSRLLSMKPRG